jgi:hypothetical protein
VSVEFIGGYSDDRQPLFVVGGHYLIIVFPTWQIVRVIGGA